MQGHASTRAEQLDALQSRVFDVLIIGGGITGCGVARDAALRGLTVALVEKDDFASGTSSRSSRLVHGGVRYLEHGHLHLVFEASAERRRLLRLAPHLVRPLQFTWPVYEGDRIPRWKLGAGLMLYDALAMFRNVGRHRRLSAGAVLEREPSLRADDLRGGAMYYDASTNDARLTLTNALAATEAGAVVVNHVISRTLIIEHDKAAGATVDVVESGRSIDVRARVVVNASGPWSGDVRALEGDTLPTVRGSKGVHIAVSRERIGNRAALTLLSPNDGRVMFALPGNEHAIVGTTDTYTSASPDDVHASREDVRYLIDSANHFFPSAKLSTDDVVSAWAGIRPLIPTTSASPSGVSREHAVATGAHGMISITGGKLTTYRVMAADVVDEVVRKLGAKVKPDETTTRVLPDGDFASLDDLIADAAETIRDDDLARHLCGTYGTRWRDVWADVARDDGRRRVVDELSYTIGELRYGVRREMALTVADLLLRRTHIGFETRDHGAFAAPVAARVLAEVFGWDVARRDHEVDAFAVEAARVFSVS